MELKELTSKELNEVEGGMILEIIATTAAALTIAYFVGYGVKKIQCELAD